MYTLGDRTVGQGGSFGAGVCTIVGSFVFMLCMTLLWWGMRGIMALGGFVATGGPYAIRHQAPDWVWILPVAIIVGVITVIVSLFCARKSGGIRVALLGWPLLFLSLGYNFLEFAFSRPRVVGGWLVCGIVFILMGGLPVLVYLRSRGRYGMFSPAAGGPLPGTEKRPLAAGIVVAQLVMMAGGVLLGTVWFRYLVS